MSRPVACSVSRRIYAISSRGPAGYSIYCTVHSRQYRLRFTIGGTTCMWIPHSTLVRLFSIRLHPRPSYDNRHAVPSLSRCTVRAIINDQREAASCRTAVSLGAATGSHRMNRPGHAYDIGRSYTTAATPHTHACYAPPPVRESWMPTAGSTYLLRRTHPS